LRAESVASSRIEGLVMSHRRLAKAAASGGHDVTADSILGNIAAVEGALAFAAGDEPFSVDAFVRVHRRLFKGTRDEPLGGVIRKRQNWIGGEATSPRSAEFIPPPADDVPRLLDDLATFCNRDDLPPVFQAAVAHVQYETIHPWMDGNGRAGRAVIGMLLVRRGVVADVLPPISLLFAAQADRYIRGLHSFRYGDPTDWFEFFAWALDSAAGASDALASDIRLLQEHWREQAGRPRSDSAAAAIIDALPSHPVITVQTIAEVTGRSQEACRIALSQLDGAGVIRQTTVGRRNRVWECVGIFKLLDTLERDVGDPARAPAGTRS
jgi:Fic family protein